MKWLTNRIPGVLALCDKCKQYNASGYHIARCADAVALLGTAYDFIEHARYLPLVDNVIDAMAMSLIPDDSQLASIDRRSDRCPGLRSPASPPATAAPPAPADVDSDPPPAPDDDDAPIRRRTATRGDPRRRRSASTDIALTAKRRRCAAMRPCPTGRISRTRPALNAICATADSDRADRDRPIAEPTDRGPAVPDIAQR